MLVEADDEAAGPDEDQEGEEDCDEDGVADAGHGDLVRPGAGHGSWLSPVASSQQMYNVWCTQLTAHTRQSRSEAHSLDFPLYFGQVSRINLSNDCILCYKTSGKREKEEGSSLPLLYEDV